MQQSPTATDVLDSLRADELRDRLERLEAERSALLVLLRAARARERAAQGRRRTAPSGEEVPHEE